MITTLGEELLREHQDKLWLYFAESDDWVGESREEIVRAFRSDHEPIHVVHGEADIPHEFCISGCRLLLLVYRARLKPF